MASVLCEQGLYVVRTASCGTKYEVVHKHTGVAEHTTPVLYEAIRIMKIFDRAVRDSEKFEPQSAEWARHAAANLGGANVPN